MTMVLITTQISLRSNMAAANVLLKTGEMVQVPEEDIAEYLEKNRDLIQIRKFKARRPLIESSEPASNSRR